ncbi:MAG: PepSY-like domain-containing protein [Mucilaginibacter sp.]
MKKTFLTTLGIVAIAGCAFGQSISVKRVPPAVKTALAKKYPQATKITWEKEHGNYEANWGGRSGEDMAVQFSPDGRFVEQTKAMAVTALPKSVVDHIKSKYPTATIKEAGYVSMADGSIRYEAEVNGKDMLFDKSGAFISEEAD